MNTPHQSSLGREVAYPSGYDPSLLFPIPRAGAREQIGIATPQARRLKIAAVVLPDE